MIVLGCDPGYTNSALVEFDPVTGRVLSAAQYDNEELLSALRKRAEVTEELVVEQIESFGMPVGKEVFETVWWTGRFMEAFLGRSSRVTRRTVKLHFCGSARAKDATIRQALIDRFGPGRTAAVGTKKAPGPLYGISGHRWQALAVALTWVDHCEWVRRGAPTPY